MRRHDLHGRREREVGEVLVIDSVKLIFCHQPHQVGELEGDDALGFEQDLHPFDEVIEVGDLGEDIVPQEQVRHATLGRQFVSSVLPKELDDGEDALPHGDLGYIRRRLDAQARDAPGHEVLEQVSVVAGEFDHMVVWAEVETFDHPLRVESGMLDPAIRV